MESDHLLDAFISAVMARVVYEGRCRALTAEERNVALREGWIHIPAQERFDRFSPTLTASAPATRSDQR
jgi:hypothetical protein